MTMTRVTPRAIVLVLDSVGVGELPDAAAYGDEGSNTLGNTARCRGRAVDAQPRKNGPRQPDADIEGVPPVADPTASWGKNAEESAGKDTTTGHWEMMGLQLRTAFPTYPDGFPPEVTGRVHARDRAGVARQLRGERDRDHPGARRRARGDGQADHLHQRRQRLPDRGPRRRHTDRRALPDLRDRARPRCSSASMQWDGSSLGHSSGPDASGAYTRTHRRRDFALEPTEPTVLDRLLERGS